MQKNKENLNFSLVSVVLAEINGFEWVIDCFTLVFAGLGRSRSILSGLNCTLPVI